MTEKVSLTLRDKVGNSCQFPNCRKNGEQCTITCDDQTESEVILCEFHFDMVRSLGQ